MAVAEAGLTQVPHSLPLLQSLTRSVAMRHLLETRCSIWRTTLRGFDDDLEQAYEDAAAVSRNCLAGLLRLRKVVSRVSQQLHRG